ncbi:MAG: hypothetical protein HYX92_00810 [Chloroflexi bacterium]|nr:hypothetical protein [Chloroflexota bacterium]
MYEVLSPLGEPTVETVAAPHSLSDLNGKTICAVWNGGFRGQVAFPVILELLRKRYPDVRVIPYTEFPITNERGSTGDLLEKVDRAVALARQWGCDAMITGMGF